MSKFFRYNWYNILLTLFVIFIFSLRFVNLTKLPVFADEAIYIRWSQVMKAEETLRFLPLSDGKQPLFMWVMMAPLKILSDPLLAGRIVSVFSGLGTLIGIGVLSFLLFKSYRLSLIASLIYAVSPFAFFFDRMALADSMLAMFGVWIFIFTYLTITKVRLDYALLAGFTLGGAWLTKSPALFFALLLPILLLFAEWPKDRSSQVKKLINIFGLLLVTYFLSFGMYNFLRLGPNFHQLATRNADYVYPLNHILIDPMNPFKTFLLMSFEWIWMMGTWVVLLLTAYGLLFTGKVNWKQKIVLTVWFLGPIIVQAEFAKVFTARYIFFTLPFLYILAAHTFEANIDKNNKLFVFLIALMVGQSLIFNKYLLTDPQKAKMHRSERSGYLEEWTAGQGIREVAEYIRKEELKNPGSKIVVGTEGYFGTLPDGLQIYLNDMPQITVIGVGLNFTKPLNPLVESKKFGNKTYLVVNDERLHADYKDFGYQLITTFPKATRPNSTRQSLLLLELTNE